MNDTPVSPLTEADPRSLDELFSSRPPFDPAALRALVAELRRMRVKWGEEERDNKAKKATRASKVKTKTVVDDLFGEGNEA